MTELPEPPQPTVDAVYEELEREAAARERYEGYGVSASALGTPCDRQLWYTLRWTSAPEPLTGLKLRRFARGNEAEDRIIRDLRRVANVQDVSPHTGRQHRFSLARGWIRGKADGIISGIPDAPQTVHVLEIKSIKAADWRAIKKHGLAAKKIEHWHQLHAGMVGLGYDRGLYIAENADTSELLTERIKLDQEEANRQEARVERLVEMHEPPLGLKGEANTEKQAEKIQASPPCRFCDHAPTCWQGAWARRTCRSCIHFAFGEAGNGHCARFDEPVTPGQQREGKDCPAHLFLPALVPGEQTDADPEAETITYRLADGTEWTDGGGDAAS